MEFQFGSNIVLTEIVAESTEFTYLLAVGNGLVNTTLQDVRESRGVMNKVYFDRNVFSALTELEGSLTEADLEKIQRSVEIGRIMILGSAPLLEETITTLGRSDEMYAKHISTVLGMIDKRRMIKPAQDLLLKDCYDYAVGLAQNDRTVPVPHRLRELLELTENKDDLRNLVLEIKKHRGTAASGLTESMGEARADHRWSKVGRPDDFDELWEKLSEHAVAFWVDACRPEIRRKCYKRGLKRMLQIKSLRFFALYYLSVAHTGLFGLKGVPRKIKHGDVGDWFHAVSASAASIFVTLESKTKPGHLGYILSLKPTPGFQVLSLQEFLAIL